MTGPSEAALLRVETVDELADTIREVHARGGTCVAVGSDSRAACGAPLASTTQRISTRALSGITRFEAEDLTCGVRVGTPWAELLDCVEAEDLTIEAGPFAQVSTRTVGGIFGEGLPSSRGFDRASLRSQLLGMSAIDGRGRVFHSGGKVVKNVAGYDLCKLFVGGGGSLFAVTEVQIRLAPMPAALALLRSELMPAQEATRLWLRTRREVVDMRACDLVVAADGSAHVECLLAGPNKLVRELSTRPGFSVVRDGHDAWRQSEEDEPADAAAFHARGRLAPSRVHDALSCLPAGFRLRVGHQGAATATCTHAIAKALPERCFLHCTRSAAVDDYTVRADADIDARMNDAFGATIAPERASFDTLRGPKPAEPNG